MTRQRTEEHTLARQFLSLHVFTWTSPQILGFRASTSSLCFSHSLLWSRPESHQQWKGLHLRSLSNPVFQALTCPSLSPVLSHHTCLLPRQGLRQNFRGSPSLAALTYRCILQRLPPQHLHCSEPRAQLCLTLCNPMDCSPQAPLFMEFSQQKNTGVGSHALLQRIFLTQGSNPCVPCFLHCRQIFYPLGCWGIPPISTPPG